MPKRTSRRDFLKGKATADLLARPTGSSHSAQDSDAIAADASHCLIQVGRDAMACRFEVFLNAAQCPQGTEAALAALDQIDELEAQLSVFRPESQTSRVNRLAAREPVEVEPWLFELLELAVRLHDETGGAFDITSGPLSDVWGFSRRQGRIPGEAELADALALVGTRHLELDASWRTVRFRRPGVKLNFGAIGKGYALDRAAEALLAAGVSDFVIHGGLSSVLARGSVGFPRDLSSPPDGWTVGLPHPLCPRQRLAEIRLRDRALGTSSPQRQSFRHQGRRFGHVLDPRSGWPAEDLLSATVLAPTAAEADALATAVFVLGPDPAIELCQGRPELAALLILPHPGGRAEIRSAGFPPGELELLGEAGEKRS